MADRRRGLVFGGEDVAGEFAGVKAFVRQKYGDAIADTLSISNYKTSRYYREYQSTLVSGEAAKVRAETFPRDIGEAGQLGFSPESFVQQQEAKATPPEAGPVTYKVVVPGKLIQASDGTYTDYDGTPMDMAVAQRILGEYKSSGEVETGLSAWEQAQLGETERARLGADWRSQQDMLAKRWEFGTQRLGQWGQFGGGATGDPAQARVWDAAQREIAGQLDPDRDWLKIWQRRQNPPQNPYSPVQEVRTSIEEARAAEAEKKAADEARKIALDELDSLNIKPERAAGLVAQASTEAGYAEMSPFNRGLLDEASRVMDLQRTISGFTDRFITARKAELKFKTGQDYFNEMEAARGVPNEQGGMTYGGAPTPSVPTPTGPATPAWLKNLYPQLGAEVAPISELGQVSGQGWNRLTGTQQSRLMGFAEFSGADPGAIIPTFNQRQAGGRTTPFGQRTSV